MTEVVRAEFGISQPAVSQHLKVLREHGFATVRPDGARRLYAVTPTPLRDVDAWLDQFRRFWTPHLDALATEIARGRRERRREHRHRRDHRHHRHHRDAPTSQEEPRMSTQEIDGIERSLGTRTLPDGAEGHVVAIAQTYAGDVAEVWDAVTNAERIPRWFLPVSRRPEGRRPVPARGQRRG